MHISLTAILEGIHISLVICVRGYTYHGDTHITVTPEHRNTGTPEHRNTGTPEHRNTGTPEHRNTGTPEHRNTEFDGVKTKM